MTLFSLWLKMLSSIFIFCTCNSNAIHGIHCTQDRIWGQVSFILQMKPEINPQVHNYPLTQALFLFFFASTSASNSSGGMPVKLTYFWKPGRYAFPIFGRLLTIFSHCATVGSFRNLSSAPYFYCLYKYY
ncbi:predicted protein [Methanosarcina acetivorans C2A]|uniref:Uncharacterized protein n=1 Tax=Methanosarcina acetivorans (strain ATCC 35395 / DSM 2834 / JCM 12185 / C2A) TaxID=188937 RepID=Q8TKY8_METAC|nr:predicted protein [Methanosarcina acetivorans C2A]